MLTRYKRQKLIAVILPICLTLALSGCGRKQTALTDAEGAAIASISGVEIKNFGDISREALTKERSAKFPAVAKLYKYQNLYAFIVKPVAYNGPVTLAVVIDGGSGSSLGVRIIDHKETPHYVRDMESNWFIGRFAGKYADEYLKLARLKAHADNEIVAITGATVTTEAVINGVNAAFGVYGEYVLGQEADAVPYMVRFEPGAGDGPTETESLAVRAYGVVIAEISLDEIRALPSVRRTMSIHSSSGTTQHSFRGTLLSNVLESIAPELMEEYNWVLAVGVDDYISGIGMEEVRAENSVFIMYEDNDEPLPKKNGGPGGMRVVVLNDVFGQRFTNYLLEIVLENEEPY
ncbi:MAG: FMN-binding protein [Oscillospiraceae bacterium]|jgi:Na+-translocating ferredoxin:NAD+ oxidoreductase RnfG subunit|nr:FMN-binding protein [Oscillospiraceae bacterium]